MAQSFMFNLSNILVWLQQKLYPQGRAFRMPQNGIMYRLHKALSISFATAYRAATGVQDAQLPDNAGFTIADARAWYRRWGIYDSGTVPFSDMKAGIRQRMSFPFVPLGMQSPEYIQAQLQAAGFNVYVYKNRFLPGPVTKTPSQILGVASMSAILNTFELGEVELGATYADYGITLIANYIEEDKDATFAIIPPDGWKGTFYIAGTTIDVFANVPASRRIELRQLILRLKSAHMCGVLFVNYV